ncbi:7-cyano-7-deazaguanine synthase [bacterium]|nr:7-cyano-7-deazaguanine synthase [bacterium]
MPKRGGAGRAAVLVSGGADSACLMAWAAEHFRTVWPIYISCGLKWETAERRALRGFLRAWTHPNVRKPVFLKMPVEDIYGRHWSVTGRGVPGRRSSDSAVHLPGRNLLLLSKAAVYCAGRGIETICLGTLAANPFRDAQLTFFSSFADMATRALGRRIRVRAPFHRLTKSGLLRRYRNCLPLHLTFSCLRPANRSGKPCGSCNKCVEWNRVRRESGRRFGS